LVHPLFEHSCQETKHDVAHYNENDDCYKTYH
jgi:hypothetical protein